MFLKGRKYRLICATLILLHLYTQFIFAAGIDSLSRDRKIKEDQEQSGYFSIRQVEGRYQRGKSVIELKKGLEKWQRYNLSSSLYPHLNSSPLEGEGRARVNPPAKFLQSLNIGIMEKNLALESLYTEMMNTTRKRASIGNRLTYINYTNGKKIYFENGKAIKIENERFKDNSGKEFIKTTFDMKYNEKNLLISYRHEIVKASVGATKVAQKGREVHPYAIIEWSDAVYTAESTSYGKKQLLGYKEKTTDSSGNTQIVKWSNCKYNDKGQLSSYRQEIVEGNVGATLVAQKRRVGKFTPAEAGAHPCAIRDRYDITYNKEGLITHYTEELTDSFGNKTKNIRQNITHLKRKNPYTLQDQYLISSYKEETIDENGNKSTKVWAEAKYEGDKLISFKEETIDSAGNQTTRLRLSTSYNNEREVTGYKEKLIDSFGNVSHNIRHGIRYNPQGEMVYYEEESINSFGNKTTLKWKDATYNKFGKLISYRQESKDEHGNVSTYHWTDAKYNNFGKLTSYKVETIDSLGNSSLKNRWDIRHNSQGKEVYYKEEDVDFLGNKTAVEWKDAVYNKSGRLSSYTQIYEDEYGNVTTSYWTDGEYNKLGNLASYKEKIIDPLGNSSLKIRRDIEYNKYGQMVCYEEEDIDSFGNKTTLKWKDATYNKSGKLISYKEDVIDSLGNSSSTTRNDIQYNKHGQIIYYEEEKRDIFGNKTTRKWHAGRSDHVGASLLAQKQDSIETSPHKKEEGYDKYGRLVDFWEEIKDTFGNSSLKIRRDIEYNKYGQMVYYEEEDIDSFGNKTTLKWKDATYNKSGKLISYKEKIIDSFGNSSSTTRNDIQYNKHGQIIYYEEENRYIFGNRTTRKWHAGRSDRVGASLLAQKQDSIKTSPHKKEEGYDKYGRLVDFWEEIIDPLGNISFKIRKDIEYDKYRQMVYYEEEDIDSFGNKTTLKWKDATYNKSGKLISYKEERIDLLGNSSLKIRRDIEYNKYGQMVYYEEENTDSFGNKTTLKWKDATYNKSGKLISYKEDVIDSLGNSSSTTRNDIQYNKHGQIIYYEEEKRDIFGNKTTRRWHVGRSDHVGASLLAQKQDSIETSPHKKEEGYDKYGRLVDFWEEVQDNNGNVSLREQSGIKYNKHNQEVYYEEREEDIFGNVEINEWWGEEYNQYNQLTRYRIKKYDEGSDNYIEKIVTSEYETEIAQKKGATVVAKLALPLAEHLSAVSVEEARQLHLSSEDRIRGKKRKEIEVVKEVSSEGERSYRISSNYKEYDKFGNIIKLIRTTDKDTAAPGKKVTEEITTAYDNQGRISRTITEVCEEGKEGSVGVYPRKEGYKHEFRITEIIEGYNNKGQVIKSSRIVDQDTSAPDMITKERIETEYDTQGKISQTVTSVTKTSDTSNRASGIGYLASGNLNHAYRITNRIDEYNHLGQVVKSTKITDKDSNAPNKVVTEEIVTSYDNKGRSILLVTKVKEIGEGLNHEYSLTNRVDEYDGLGQVAKATVITMDGGMTREEKITNTYDGEGRIVKTITDIKEQGDGLNISWQEIKINEKYNSLGKVLKSTKVTIKDGITTEEKTDFIYDSQGSIKTSHREVSEKSEDGTYYNAYKLDTINEGYNSLGQLVKSVTKKYDDSSASGMTVTEEKTVSYDALGRVSLSVTKINERGNGLDHGYTLTNHIEQYNSLGQVIKASLITEDGAERREEKISNVYDAYGRVIKSVRDIKDRGKGEWREEKLNERYDSLGRVLKATNITIKNGITTREEVNFKYDNQGRIKGSHREVSEKNKDGTYYNAYKLDTINEAYNSLGQLVKSVTKKYDDSSASGMTVTEERTTSYDTQGRVLQTIIHITEKSGIWNLVSGILDRTYTEITQNLYNDLNQVTHCRKETKDDSKNPDMRTIEEITNTYDTKGRVIKVVDSIAEIDTETGYKLNRKYTVTTTNEAFNALGQVTKQTIVTKDGDRVETHKRSNMSYNSKGQLYSYDDFYVETGVRDSIREIIYNDLGMVKEKRGTKSWGSYGGGGISGLDSGWENGKVNITQSYTYDSQGRVASYKIKARGQGKNEELKSDEGSWDAKTIYLDFTQSNIKYDNLGRTISYNQRTVQYTKENKSKKKRTWWGGRKLVKWTEANLITKEEKVWNYAFNSFGQVTHSYTEYRQNNNVSGTQAESNIRYDSRGNKMSSTVASTYYADTGSYTVHDSSKKELGYKYDLMSNLIGTDTLKTYYENQDIKTSNKNFFVTTFGQIVGIVASVVVGVFTAGLGTTLCAGITTAFSAVHQAVTAYYGYGASPESIWRGVGFSALIGITTLGIAKIFKGFFNKVGSSISRASSGISEVFTSTIKPVLKGGARKLNQILVRSTAGIGAFYTGKEVSGTFGPTTAYFWSGFTKVAVSGFSLEGINLGFDTARLVLNTTFAGIANNQIKQLGKESASGGGHQNALENWGYIGQMFQEITSTVVDGIRQVGQRRDEGREVRDEKRGIRDERRKKVTDIRGQEMKISGWEGERKDLGDGLYQFEGRADLERGDGIYQLTKGTFFVTEDGKEILIEGVLQKEGDIFYLDREGERTSVEKLKLQTRDYQEKLIQLEKQIQGELQYREEQNKQLLKMVNILKEGKENQLKNPSQMDKIQVKSGEFEKLDSQKLEQLSHQIDQHIKEGEYGKLKLVLPEVENEIKQFQKMTKQTGENKSNIAEVIQETIGNYQEITKSLIKLDTLEGEKFKHIRGDVHNILTEGAKYEKNLNQLVKYGIINQGTKEILLNEMKVNYVKIYDIMLKDYQMGKVDPLCFSLGKALMRNNVKTEFQYVFSEKARPEIASMMKSYESFKVELKDYMSSERVTNKVINVLDEFIQCAGVMPDIYLTGKGSHRKTFLNSGWMKLTREDKAGIFFKGNSPKNFPGYSMEINTLTGMISGVTFKSPSVQLKEGQFEVNTVVPLKIPQKGLMPSIGIGLQSSQLFPKGDLAKRIITVTGELISDSNWDRLRSFSFEYKGSARKDFTGAMAGEKWTISMNEPTYRVVRIVVPTVAVIGTTVVGVKVISVIGGVIGSAGAFGGPLAWHFVKGVAMAW